MYETSFSQKVNFIENLTMNESFIKFGNSQQLKEEWIKQEESNIFVDPYDSMWIKVVITASFLIQILESGILVSFVFYETQGFAGPYRTVINQLLSGFYTLVSKMKFKCYINLKLIVQTQITTRR